MIQNLWILVLVVEETFQRIGLNKKEHLETNLKKSNATEMISRFIDILLKYLSDYQNPENNHSFHQRLGSLKQFANKIGNLDTDLWNDVLKEANMGNDISFFASKGDKYAIPRKNYQSQLLDRRKLSF